MATNFPTITSTWSYKDLTDQGTQHNGLFLSCNVIGKVIQRFITGYSFGVRQERSPLIREKHTKLCKKSLGSKIMYVSREWNLRDNKKPIKLPIYTT